VTIRYFRRDLVLKPGSLLRVTKLLLRSPFTADRLIMSFHEAGGGYAWLRGFCRVSAWHILIPQGN